MTKSAQVHAFILAGGSSSRMGSDKALLEWNGEPLILRAARLLDPLVAAVTVIGEPARYSVLGLDVVPDGLALTRDGRLLVSCYRPDRIYLVSPDGKRKETLIEDPEGTVLAGPTNIAFGGPDRRTLFAANLNREHITRIPTDLEGAPVYAG